MINLTGFLPTVTSFRSENGRKMGNDTEAAVRGGCVSFQQAFWWESGPPERANAKAEFVIYGPPLAACRGNLHVCLWQAIIHTCWVISTQIKLPKRPLAGIFYVFQGQPDIGESSLWGQRRGNIAHGKIRRPFYNMSWLCYLWPFCPLQMDILRSINHQLCCVNA